MIDIAVNNARLLSRRDKNLLKIDDEDYLSESKLEDSLNEENVRYSKKKKMYCHSINKKDKQVVCPTSQQKPSKLIAKPKTGPLDEISYDKILQFNEGGCKFCISGQTTTIHSCQLLS